MHIYTSSKGRGRASKNKVPADNFKNVTGYGSVYRITDHYQNLISRSLLEDLAAATTL